MLTIACCEVPAREYAGLTCTADSALTCCVTRRLVLQWARGFVGRLMADPAFVQKLVGEQLMAFTASMFYEWRVRGDNFKKVCVCLL